MFFGSFMESGNLWNCFNHKITNKNNNKKIPDKNRNSNRYYFEYLYNINKNEINKSVRRHKYLIKLHKLINLNIQNVLLMSQTIFFISCKVIFLEVIKK